MSTDEKLGQQIKLRLKVKSVDQKLDHQIKT